MENNTKITVTLRLPQQLRDDIAEIAGKEHRSIGGQVIMMLESAVEDYLKRREGPAS